MRRMDGLNNRAEIKNILKNVFNVIDIFKRYCGADYQEVALFYLAIYKDGFFEKEHEFDDYLAIIRPQLLDSKYFQLAEEYQHVFEKIPPGILKEVSQIYCTIDIEFLKNNISEVIDLSLIEIFKYERDSFEILPNEIAKFIMDIADLKKGNRIFNPFSNLASFAVNKDKNISYYGQELNKRLFNIGNLRMLAHGHFSDISNMTSTHNDSWILSYDSDLIVAQPPINSKMTHLSEMENYISHTEEQYFIQKGIEILTHNPISSKNQKLIALMSVKFLTSKSLDYGIRKKLINYDLIDTIIVLPKKLLTKSSIQLCIVFLNNNKKQKGFTKFIDAKNFIKKTKSMINVLDNKALFNIVSKNDETDYLKYISNSQVIKNDYNLSVRRNIAREFFGVLLSEMCNILTGERPLVDSGRVINIKDLHNVSFKNILDINKLESNIEIAGLKKIGESCILLARIGNVLKPTYFKYTNTPVYIKNSIIALKVNKEKINVEYLVNELMSAAVIEQVNIYNEGSAIPSISIKDLLAIKINLIPIVEQIAVIKGLGELDDRIVQLQKERNAIKHGYDVGSFNEIASLKHSLGAPRQNILSNSKHLYNYFNSNNSKEFEIIKNTYSNKYGMDLIKVFKQIELDINQISLLLQKGEGGYKLENFTKEIMSINNVIDLIDELNFSNFKFIIFKTIVDINIEEEDFALGIETNLDLLKILFDNILTNADKYGYKANIADNVVEIITEVVDNKFEIQIMNNGNPFPVNFDREKFISKFTTQDSTIGSGIGGYDINRIAKYLGDENWELVLDETSFHPVQFKFAFPIKPIE